MNTKPTFVQIGRQYVNVSQIAFAEYQPERNAGPEELGKPGDRDYDPAAANRPHHANAHLHIKYSGGSDEDFDGEEAMTLKRKLDKMLV